MACSSALAAKSAEPPMRAAIDLAPLSKLNPFGSRPCSSKYFCPRATDHGRCASSPSCEYAKVTGSPADPASVGSNSTSASTRTIRAFIETLLSRAACSQGSDCNPPFAPSPCPLPRWGRGIDEGATEVTGPALAYACSQGLLLPV